MGTYNPPIKGAAFQIRIALTSMTADGSFVSTPSISAGDFKVDKDGAGLTNMTNLPTVSPSGGVCVLLSSTATEMTADVVTIVGISQTNPKSWADVVVSIPTA